MMRESGLIGRDDVTPLTGDLRAYARSVCLVRSFEIAAPVQVNQGVIKLAGEQWRKRNPILSMVYLVQQNVVFCCTKNG